MVIFECVTIVFDRAAVAFECVTIVFDRAAVVPMRVD
jgi:hypothetical protein